MAAKRKRRAPPKRNAKKTDTVEEEVEETDKSLNETMESEENAASTEDGASQNGEGTEEDADNSQEIKTEADSEDEEAEANGDEPPQKKSKSDSEKLTLFLANLPPESKPESIKEALEAEVGEGKVVTLRQSTRRRPTFYSSSTIYFADVADRETLEKLISLDQKLQIGGQEVIIEEDKKRDDNLKIVISNIPEESNNKEVLLNLLAGEIGGPEKVEVVRVIIDKKTSRPTDTAHIYLTDTEAVKLLVELEPKLSINGQELVIEESELNKTRREKLKLFIGRIPINSCNEDAVRAALEAEVGEGKVLAIRCPKDWMSGRPRGIAFANCADEETVKKLTSLDTKIKIDDQEINIMENELSAKKDELYKVFISNLPQATTEEKFKEKILEVMSEDDIESITFPLDKDESKSRGFAFITLKSNDAMKKLLALDQKLELEDCELNIRVCHEASSDQSRGRGGKGRGFKGGRDSYRFSGRGSGRGYFGGGRSGGGGFNRRSGGYGSDWYGGPGGPRNSGGGGYRGGSRGSWKRGGFGSGGGGGFGGSNFGGGGGGGGGRYGMQWF